MPRGKVYEVQRIVGQRKRAGKIEYLIKWAGYEEKTWEENSNLVECSEALREFQLSKQADAAKRKRNSAIAKPGKRQPASKNSPTNSRLAKLDRSLPLSFPIIPSSFDQTERWRSILGNAQGPPISVYNDVDDCGPPIDFIYIDDNLYHPSVPSFDRTFLIGCECRGSKCTLAAHNDSGAPCDCAETSGRQVPYDKSGCLKSNFLGPIYECNSKCLCDPDLCGLRQVQKGLKFHLQIYRTANNCGWGVRTLEPIPRGSFVAKYTGEVVTDKEAERRGRLYDFIGRTYLFDIDGLLDDDEEDEDDMFGLDNISFVQKSKGAAVDRLTIDAFHYGNISRFFNHSCDPTLTVYACFIENQDPRCHEVVFFANRDINQGEDLTFDYTGGKILDSDDATYVKCFCGSRTCRLLVAM